MPEFERKKHSAFEIHGTKFDHLELEDFSRSSGVAALEPSKAVLASKTTIETFRRKVPPIILSENCSSVDMRATLGPHGAYFIFICVMCQ
jgi:hypothetical protein